MRVHGVRANDRPLPTYVPNLPMDNMATDFFGPREHELIPFKTVEPQVREYVGYTVPSWGLIVGTLLGFSAVAARRRACCCGGRGGWSTWAGSDQASPSPSAYFFC